MTSGKVLCKGNRIGYNPGMAKRKDNQLIIQKVLVIHKSVLVNKLRLLILKRSSKDQYNPGKWEFPGGKLEECIDIAKFLEDKVLEETGLLITGDNKMAFYSTEIGTHGKYKGSPILRFVGVAGVDSDKVKLTEEHEEFKWVTLNQAFDEDLVPWARKALMVLKEDVKDRLWRN